MTMLLAHPDAEDLGRFIEGTLDDAGRASIVDHIADCDECRVMVVDATELNEPAHTADRRRWLATAAAIAIVLGGVFTWYRMRDPATPVIEATAHLRWRPVDARLSGFIYRERPHFRGGSDQEETDPAESQLYIEVAKVMDLQGDDPRTLHAKGIALLVTAELNTKPSQIVAQRKEAVDLLESAARRERNNVSYQSDLAGALIATGDLVRAIEVTDRALQIDARSAEALFNRAKAFESLNQPEKAISAYKAYLAVDSSTKWAKEAKGHLEWLQSSLSPT
jgi:hypothetical protein